MTVAGRKAVFLDRDGVLNKSIVIDGMPTSPFAVEQTELYDDVADACRRLRDAGYMLICVTNQPDIARGKQTAANVDAINDHIRSALGLDDVRVCPHDDDDGCHCRKPKPGLILDAARDYGIDCVRSAMVGDRWRDVDAGRAAGCATVFIDRGYHEAAADADSTCAGLGEAADWILGRGSKTS